MTAYDSSPCGFPSNKINILAISLVFVSHSPDAGENFYWNIKTNHYMIFDFARWHEVDLRIFL